MLADEGAGSGEVESQEEFRHILSKSPSNQPGYVPSPVTFQRDCISPGHQASFPQSVVDHSAAARKSTHERKPAQMLTY